MGYLPFTNEQINLAVSSYTPNTIKAYNNGAFCFWQRSLLQRAMSKIDFDNWPDIWNEQGVLDMWYFILFCFGYLGICENNEFGKFFTAGKLSGQLNIYYQYKQFSASNPALNKSKLLNYEIGKDCEIVKLTPDYRGIMDIVNYYAEKLALNDTAVNTSLINAKIPYILGGKTKSAIYAIKQILDMVNRGEPAAFYKSKIYDDAKTKEEPWQQVKLFTKADMITPELLEAHATLLNAFDTEIGIKTLPYNKKERLVTEEAESKSEESQARLTTWIRTLNTSLDIVNKHFGFNIKAKIHEDKEKEVSADGEDNTLRT